MIHLTAGLIHRLSSHSRLEAAPTVCERGLLGLLFTELLVLMVCSATKKLFQFRAIYLNNDLNPQVFVAEYKVVPFSEDSDLHESLRCCTNAKWLWSSRHHSDAPFKSLHKRTVWHFNIPVSNIEAHRTLNISFFWTIGLWRSVCWNH